MEEQEEFATALLQDSHDDLMARINKTREVEDPSNNELNDGEDVESTGAGAGGEGSRCRHHRHEAVCAALAGMSTTLEGFL